MDPLETAHRLVRTRFPQAHAVFLAGSVLTAQRTPWSDLDIVVLLAGPPAPYRESLTFGGWPVELFVLTEKAWLDFAERETAARRSPLLAMCADGMLLVDTDGSGAELQARARRRLAQGPPPLSADELGDLRYALTDTLDDLRGCADPDERFYLVADLLQQTSRLALLAGGCWTGSGKWLSRRLAAADPDLHGRLVSAAGQAVAGTAAAFEAVVNEVLERSGGPLWSGYARHAV